MTALAQPALNPSLPQYEPWFCRSTLQSAPVRLFCFPFAGGNATTFLPWQAHLGPQIELCAIQPPARGARLLEPPLDTMPALLDALLPAITPKLDRPFAFFGHSLGGLVAFELARALRRQGLPLPDSLWISGTEGPQTRQLRDSLHTLPDAGLIAALRDYNGTPAALLEDAELMALVLPGVRGDFAVAERYAYQQEAPLDLPIHLLLADADPWVDAERASGWARESSRPLQTDTYAGDHFFIQPHMAAITARLRQALTKHEVALP